MIQQRQIAFPPDFLAEGGSNGGAGIDDAAAPAPLDGVTSSLPPWAAGFGASSASPIPGGGILSGILGELSSMLSQIIALFGGGAAQGSASPQTFYQQASGSSAGDPHLAFDGTTRAGAQAHARFDSMQSQNDLLDSDSFTGGYRVATTVTPPNAQGVTYNQSAVVTTDFGGTAVSLDASGAARILEDGSSTALSDGASIDLGNGELVSRGTDGAVSVTDYSASGGSISTTMRDNGPGVDVAVQANGVDLGGALAAATPPSPPPPRWGEPVPASTRPAQR